MEFIETKFCRGNDSLWDFDQTWNTRKPEVSECARKTVCVWVPSLLLHAGGLMHVLLCKKNPRKQKCCVTPLFVIKTLALLSLLALYVAEYLSITGVKLPLDHIYCGVMTEAVYLSLLLVVYDRCNGVITSVVQFFFWSTMCLLQIPNLISNIYLILDGNQSISVILGTVQYCLVALLLVLQFWPDLTSREAKVKSEAKASFTSTLTFYWLEFLFWIGFKRELKIEDLPSASDGLKVEGILENFGRNVPESNQKWDVLRVLLKSFGGSMAGGMLIKMLSDILLFTVPQVLRMFIRSMETADYKWKGYFWTMLLFFISTVQVTLVNQYFRKMHRVGFKMKTAVTSAIFKKGLKLAPVSRARYTTGEITNLMAIDAQRFIEVMPYINVLWAAPIQCSLAIYFLYDLIGISAIAGLSVVLICLPVNFLSGKLGKKLQKKQLKAKDERIMVMNEVLQGAKVMKLYAWEIPFTNRILEIRNKELYCLKGNAFIWANTSVTFSAMSAFVTLVSFAAYVYQDPVNNVLTAEKIFTCLAIFNIIRIPMFLMPPFLMETIKLVISMKRINAFLNADEVDPSAIEEVKEDANDAIRISEATFDWGSQRNSNQPTLNKLNVSVPKGKLVAVLGKVGSGKSSLLSAVLGDMQLKSGHVSRSGSIAYVPQQAWIQNMTLRRNILFGREFNIESYQSTIEACALVEDLEILPAGDETEIGENGVNLSGGQKQRVNLARAVYNEADIYLLDDPLSAVDAHVGEHLFQNVIGPEGLLNDATRILVTHSVTFLSKMDHIILLDEGSIIVQGSYDEVNSNNHFQDFVRHVVFMEEEQEEEKKTRVKSKVNGHAGAQFKSLSERNKLVKDETMAKGRVKSEHLKAFLRKFNTTAFIAIIFLFLFCEFLHTYSVIVLSQWSDYVNVAEDVTLDDHFKYLRFFCILISIQSVFDYIREFAFMYCCVLVSKKTHKAALEGIMRAPMLFFDSNPTGRTVNRFSSDMDLIDQKVPSRLTDALWCYTSVIAKLILIAYNTPVILAFFLPIMLLLGFLQVFYASTKRQLKRLEAVNKSPIYSKFSESIQGMSVIRAYKQQSRFIFENESMIQTHLSCNYLNEMAARWISLRVEYVGNLIILLTGIFTVYFLQDMTAGMGALIVSMAVMILDELGWCLKMTCECEADSVAMERLREYECLEGEDDWFTKDKKFAHEIKGWPQDGSITFKNYSTRYRKDLDDCIKGLNLKVNEAEKLGVCGRTGAGKSSLTLALFRMIDPTSGSLFIGGRDVMTIGLQDLRKQLTIIPQDPVLFSGTLRFNLDPVNSFEDKDLFKALNQAHLSKLVESLPNGLNEHITEGGKNLSVGQRQLVCLARALLKRTKIIVLDEATAAMDSGTDEAIQETLSNEFQGCTIITIAHRINTILNSDRILVMSEGRAVECDQPEKLLDQTDSEFRKMCLNAGVLGN